jgi:alpha-beta hydrolase superfamily lysophospholipase
MRAKLPEGLQQFHKDRFINFQINRWYSLGFTRLQDLQRAARGIKSFDDYTRSFSSLAEEAEAEGRLENAAFYYRAAEFLTRPSNPDKMRLYNRFIELFYRAFNEDNIGRKEVPYKNGCLRAMTLSASSKPGKGTIVIHGGFDSLIEEFYCIWEYFAQAGYEVIAFDGPGQGGALRQTGLTFEHDWEGPVKAVLDYFNRPDVTLLGISMGGYWCLRAAAFEKRVKRVIVFPPVYDWMEGTNGFNQRLVNVMLKWDWLMNCSIRLKMKSPLMEHVVNQTLFITGKKELADVVHWQMSMNKRHLRSDLVDQDVLLLAGEKDFFQPVVLYQKQKKALTNARSVTGRIFTEADGAAYHCGIGNMALPLKVMAEWLEQIE